MVAEVVSPSNTSTEIEEKRLEYFEAGVLAVERARYQRELDAAVKSAKAAGAQKADQEAARREASLRAEAAEEVTR